MRLNRLLYALLLVITMQSFSLAQEREVSGSVKDVNGDPLFGAAVVVEGNDPKITLLIPEDEINNNPNIR